MQSVPHVIKNVLNSVWQSPASSSDQNILLSCFIFATSTNGAPILSPICETTWWPTTVCRFQMLGDIPIIDILFMSRKHRGVHTLFLFRLFYYERIFLSQIFICTLCMYTVMQTMTLFSFISHLNVLYFISLLFKRKCIFCIFQMSKEIVKCKKANTQKRKSNIV